MELKKIVEDLLDKEGIYAICSKYGLSHATVYAATEPGYMPKTRNTKLAFQKMMDEASGKGEE